MKVIVAGAGHGGLCAGIRLAKAGAEVTVFEKRKREELGYDWEDTMTVSSFEKAGLPAPGAENFRPMEHMGFLSPDCRLLLTALNPSSEKIGYIERKFLISYLLGLAEDAGVKLVFETEVMSPVTKGLAVTGVTLRDEDGEREASADLVIDAAGVDSPVRGNLPKYFGIPRRFDEREVFIAYRAYFENLTGEHTAPGHLVYFYHKGLPGMDWAITTGNVVDVLIGGFGRLTETDVEINLADFRERYPFMGKEVKRGGIADRIPLAKSPALFIADGYACVGNSASMTEPLSGSGIDLSLSAGRLLADAVIGSGMDASAKTLWGYEREYFLSHASRYLGDYVIKSFLSSLAPRDVDFFFHSRIMTAKEIGGGAAYTPKELLEKLRLLKRPDLLPRLAQTGVRLSRIGTAKKSVPERFDRRAIFNWSRLYAGI